jgi:hypothetical protein
MFNATGFTNSSNSHFKSEYEGIIHKGQIIVFGSSLLIKQTHQVVWQMAASPAVILMVCTLLQ